MPDDETRNIALLQGVLTYIEEHPEEWDQEHWVSPCGTAFCFAGHAVNLHHGDNIIYARNHEGYYHSTGSFAYKDDGVVLTDIPDEAQCLLGLSDNEATELFASTNTLDDLREMVERLVEAQKRRDNGEVVVEINA